MDDQNVRLLHKEARHSRAGNRERKIEIYVPFKGGDTSYPAVDVSNLAGKSHHSFERGGNDNDYLRLK